MNIENHILITLAQTYPQPTISLAPDGCYYDESIGAWIISHTGQLLADDKDKRPKPPTKKHDIETGEDQKGE